MTESKIFVDTAPYIYYLEKSQLYYDVVKKFFNDNYESENYFFTSAITVEEYSVVPFRNNDVELLRDFSTLLEETETIVSNIDKDIALRAAQIRAEYKHFKAMDALQLATAVANKCDIFVTNDKQLKQFTDIKVVTVEEL